MNETNSEKDIPVQEKPAEQQIVTEEVAGLRFMSPLFSMITESLTKRLIMRLHIVLEVLSL